MPTTITPPICRLCGKPLEDLADIDKSGVHLSCVDARERLGELVAAARSIPACCEGGACPPRSTPPQPAVESCVAIPDVNAPEARIARAPRTFDEWLASPPWFADFERAWLAVDMTGGRE